MPMNIAIGMVAITVKMPHGLSARALTTISASTARMMIMIRKQPNSAMVPGMRPISSRTMSPRERPLRRVDRNRTMKSCTAPANTTPAISQSVPGR
nr:hypothetical protein GCM10020185_45360 [Pseudomonas brassicacearum subsp. brassicacearum]